MSLIFKLSEYDVFFLSFDEPNADDNFNHLKQHIPKIKRVHGILGSDRAHKECARQSTTDRLIIIDGDNWVWGNILDQEVTVDADLDPEQIVLSWPSRNKINNLLYGNGGIKCWHRNTILNMRTHEEADPNDIQAQVDFCFKLTYLPLNENFSDIINDCTPLQAWRAGFREGVKMCLNNGVKVTHFNDIPKENLLRLKIWLTVGSHLENGIYAILGARQACHMTIYTDWNYIQVRDFNYLNTYFSNNVEVLSVEQVIFEINDLGEILSPDIDIPAELIPENISRYISTLNYNPARQPSYITTKKISNYDIVMITYDEINADENFRLLQSKYPRAKRIHGVKGIHQAHVEAAKIVNTPMFWVVDGDAVILENFNFDFYLKIPDDIVRVWRCKNPVNDLIYGYGGVKLLPTDRTLNMSLAKPDMTTSISDQYMPVQELSNITNFNVSPFHTWRSAFRECCKLSSKIIDRQKDEETLKRLDTWCTQGLERMFGEYAVAGAKLGRQYGEINKNDHEALKKINDFSWLQSMFESNYGGLK